MNEELQNEYVDVNVHDSYPSSDEHITVPPMQVAPLKKICMTIGALPTSYLETMTYYEMLLWFIGYLRDTIIPTVNNNGEALQEVQTIVMSLQNYINDYKDSIDQDIEDLEAYMNDYFENLDVQEEINNKLDSMAESGELTDIIAQYLGLAGMIAFDTVADMKLAQNLVNGSKCETLGFHQVNDGGGSKYKIRPITNLDDVDEMKIIALYNENLIAELVIDSNIIKPKQFGAYCDGIHDDSDVLEACLNFTDTLTSSNGTGKRTILIDSPIKVTRRIDCTKEQFKIMGTSINNARINFVGSTSYLNIGTSNNKSFEIEIENIKLYGDYSQTQSILKMTKCDNCYLTRVETCNGGENQYNISFIDCGLIYMDKCTVTGSNDVANYPGNRNGIYINKLGSIFNFTNANCWNLNNLFKFDGLMQNVNIQNNWIECIKSFMEFNCVTDMRYMNIKIENNTINTHTQDTNFVPTTFNFISLAMAEDTNLFNSSFTINRNTIYLWNVTSIQGNSLIYLDGIGGSTSSSWDINYNSNIFSGQTLTQLSAYVFYNSVSAFYNRYNVKFKSFTPSVSTDSNRATDDKKIMSCVVAEGTRGFITAPTGIYLTKGAVENYGNLYYDGTNDEFYGGYGGSAKKLPKGVTTAFEYATSSTDMVDYMNRLTSALVSANIIKRQT